MNEKTVDILIVGGGLTGATLMLALQGLGYSMALVEAKPFKEKVSADFDARSLALSPASIKILSMLKLWERIKPHACPIHHIHVSDQHRFGAARLQGDALSPLGYVVEIQYINQALDRIVPKEEIIAPAKLIALDKENLKAVVQQDDQHITIQAKLIIAADGSESAVRQFCGLTAQEKDYGQQALVTNIGLAKPHHNKAFERFTAQGPIALLPMNDNRMSLVWAEQPEEAKRLSGLSDQDFLKALQQAFGYRLGRFVKTGKRFNYPLKQVLMTKQVEGQIIFVGNAAHTLHPVAGQGFNLGLRDVASLAQCIVKHGLTQAMSKEYQTIRQHDQTAITGLTDGLIKVFTSKLPGMGLARNLGLLVLDSSPSLKKLLAHYARGFAGVIPDLVCEIPLATQPKESDHAIL